MTSLLTNNAAMTALTTLKSINTQLDMTSNRVSTGQRVSSAADNAAYWSIATTVRTDNASLSAVKDSLGLGSSAVDTTYNGLNSIITDLQNMRAKLQTALQPGVDRAKVQTEITAIQSKMKATADSSVSSGQNWLSVDSSASNTAYQATQSVIAGFSRATNGTISYSKINVEVSNIKLYDVNAASASVPATEAQVAGSTSLTGTSAFTAGTADFSAASGKQVNFTINLNGSKTQNIKLDATTLGAAVKDLAKVTTDEVLSAINNQIAASTGANSVKGLVAASLDTQGRIVLKTTTAAAASTINVDVVAATGTNTLVDIGFGTTAGTAVVAGKGTDAGTSNAKGILDTVDGTTSQSINSINISALSGTTGDATLATLISQVDKAISSVTNAGTKLGANKTQIDGQKTFVDTLMKANDRTIGILVDADVEEESTKLKALQTQQQLAVQALSIANGASANVLSLFR
ncbi:flagellin [Methylobacterium sp.]|uniref:flagellin N-terminal helical domain-containing protein n=1 Tax=Methylobacterium sp. TaxID=409 RepID=UPI0025CE6EBA|nr:flagellin [Methylobacterium sp.]MBY0260075.1 flagellin [Methylobacterium sp.]